MVDVSELMIGQNIRVGEIPMSGSMKLTSLPEAVVSHVVSLKAEEVAAETAAATPAAGEPEVIKKGKKEEEGGAEAPAKKK